MLDPARARAEADAAERRGAGTLWAAGPVEWEGVSAGTVEQAEVVPVIEEAAGDTLGARPRLAALPRMEAPRGTQEVPTALLAAILARLEMVPPAGGVPVWLVEAIGNPLTYDAAAPYRKDVCARVDPALYRDVLYGVVVRGRSSTNAKFKVGHDEGATPDANAMTGATDPIAYTQVNFAVPRTVKGAVSPSQLPYFRPFVAVAAFSGSTEEYVDLDFYVGGKPF